MTPHNHTYSRAYIRSPPELVSLINSGAITKGPFLQQCTVVADRSQLRDDECAICLRPLSVGKPVSNSICSHILHRKCTKLLLKRSLKCPLCRVEWYSDDKSTCMAERIRTTIRTLERSGTFDLPVLAVDDKLDEVLGSNIRVTAHCMLVQDIEGLAGEWRGLENRELALEEEGVMREVAASEDGWEIVGCLLDYIEHVGLFRSELLACATAEFEEDERIMRSSSRDAWDWASCKMIRSLQREAIEPGYIDVWTLAARLAEVATSRWEDHFDCHGLEEPVAQFLMKVIVWCLMSWIKGSCPAAADIPIPIPDEQLDIEDLLPVPTDIPMPVLDEPRDIAEIQEPGRLHHVSQSTFHRRHRPRIPATIVSERSDTSAKVK